MEAINQRITALEQQATQAAVREHNLLTQLQTADDNVKLLQQQLAQAVLDASSAQATAQATAQT